MSTTTVNMKAYLGLMVVSLLATIGAILTLIPASGASYPNVFGYRSLCTFAPAATLYCASIAGLCCVLRASLVKRRAAAGRPQFRRGPIVVVAALLILAVGSTVWFVDVKGGYPDGNTAPTAQPSG